jgi:hypothetical protein
MVMSPRSLAFVTAFFVLSSLAASSSRAEGLDAASGTALTETTRLLKSKTEREKAIKDNPNAQSVDQMVKSVGGSEGGTEAIYGMSSEVFENVAKEAAGDPVKMQEIITKANQDPKGFYEKYFTVEQKAKLQQMSKGLSTAPSMAREPSAQKR